MYAFFTEVKNCRAHTDIILVNTWDISLYYVGQEVVIAYFFSSLKDPWNDPGVWGFLLGLDGGEGTSFMAYGGPGFRCVFFVGKSE